MALFICKDSQNLYFTFIYSLFCHFVFCDFLQSKCFLSLKQIFSTPAAILQVCVCVEIINPHSSNQWGEKYAVI